MRSTFAFHLSEFLNFGLFVLSNMFAEERAIFQQTEFRSFVLRCQKMFVEKKSNFFSSNVKARFCHEFYMSTTLNNHICIETNQ